MITKHFFKTLIFFTALIATGLIGVFLVSYFDQDEAPTLPETTNASD